MCFRRYYLAGVSSLMAGLFSVVAFADNLVRPDPSIAPAEVVAIQLMSLKNNDLVEADFGIRQTWSFAHPQNRKITGPFPRFAMMLKGPGYDVLLNHKSHSIKTGSNTASGQTNDGEMWQRLATDSSAMRSAHPTPASCFYSPSFSLCCLSDELKLWLWGT